MILSDMVSVLIPSRNELFVRQTIDDVFRKASGNVEVIVTLDGYWPDPPLEDRDKLILIHRSVAKGMRHAINSAAAVAHGKWLMKTDAHCLFAEGWDEVLKKDCADNEVVIPRRYSLDAENWCKTDKRHVDYHYLSCPLTNPDGFSMHGCYSWSSREGAKVDLISTTTMPFRG